MLLTAYPCVTLYSGVNLKVISDGYPTTAGSNDKEVRLRAVAEDGGGGGGGGGDDDGDDDHDIGDDG